MVEIIVLYCVVFIVFNIVNDINFNYSVLFNKLIGILRFLVIYIY